MEPVLPLAMQLLGPQSPMLPSQRVSKGIGECSARSAKEKDPAPEAMGHVIPGEDKTVHSPTAGPEQQPGARVQFPCFPGFILVSGVKHTKRFLRKTS